MQHIYRIKQLLLSSFKNCACSMPFFLDSDSDWDRKRELSFLVFILVVRIQVPLYLFRTKSFDFAKIVISRFQHLHLDSVQGRNAIYIFAIRKHKSSRTALRVSLNFAQHQIISVRQQLGKLLLLLLFNKLLHNFAFHFNHASLFI